ncbi:sigma-70 family RNA polymerase sigma factor [Nocardioides sp.]|uniref:RNA polymerase sigma factor n=1 Tax=Nocardioides sp. TaxID=35761 RepID=UPI00261528A7|nr:sigma-70 family RNA polymerase sigma factor [Nocardioides sp.]
MNEHEFEKVFWVVQPQLVRFALTQLDRAGAEDAVSNTLLALWRKDLDYPEDAVAERQLQSLAFQVLSGHVSNEYRSRRRRRALLDRLATLREGELVAAGDIAGDAAAQAESNQWLGRLSPADRQVITLFNEGFDIEETARILGCSASAASKRRTRARDRLRAIVTADHATAVHEGRQ